VRAAAISNECHDITQKVPGLPMMIALAIMVASALSIYIGLLLRCSAHKRRNTGVKISNTSGDFTAGNWFAREIRIYLG